MQRRTKREERNVRATVAATYGGGEEGLQRSKDTKVAYKGCFCLRNLGTYLVRVLREIIEELRCGGRRIVFTVVNRIYNLHIARSNKIRPPLVGPRQPLCTSSFWIIFVFNSLSEFQLELYFVNLFFSQPVVFFVSRVLVLHTHEIIICLVHAWHDNCVKSTAPPTIVEQFAKQTRVNGFPCYARAYYSIL